MHLFHRHQLRSIILFEAVCIVFLLITTLIVRLMDVNVANVQKTLSTRHSSDGRTVEGGIHKE